MKQSSYIVSVIVTAISIETNEKIFHLLFRFYWIVFIGPKNKTAENKNATRLISTADLLSTISNWSCDLVNGCVRRSKRSNLTANCPFCIQYSHAAHRNVYGRLKKKIEWTKSLRRKPFDRCSFGFFNNVDAMNLIQNGFVIAGGAIFLHISTI